MQRGYARWIALVTVLVLVVGGSLLSGCATLGPTYQKAEKIPENYGLVNIYRPASFIGGGVSYDIKVGDNNVVTTLYNGGYYPYHAKPGETEFWAKTETKSAVTIEVKPGETYYIKGTVGVGFIVGRPHLIVVSPEVGEKEIVECKLIPEPAKEEKER